jgi:nucleotide-binding universal stress UspA family protein
MTRIQKILHPTDFSENAGHAFTLACSLARDFGARLILAHVHPPPFEAPTELAPPPAPGVPPKAPREKLKALRPEDPKVAVEHYFRVGDEAEEIIRLAEEEGCDLIVMGTQGRTALGRLLMGSVAEQVLRRAPCPVLTVKQPFPGAETRPEPAPETDVTIKVG